MNFDTDKISGMLITMSVPTIIAQAVNALYNLVDRMYIGHMPEVGSIALTSIGLTFPILQGISAFSLLIGMGGGPLLSIWIGEKKEEEAAGLMGTSLFLLLILGAVLTAVCYFKAESLLLLFGANEAMTSYGVDYLKVYSIGILPSMITMGMTPFLNAQGETKLSTLVLVLGAAINIILDPVFIFYLDMGVKGAALASDIAQIACAILILYVLTGSKNIRIRLKARNICFKFSQSLRICGLGISSFAFSINESIFQVFMNLLIRYHAGYGTEGDLYIGAMTVICSLYQIFYMPLKGVVQAAQPLVGYYYGSKQFDRLKQTIRYARYATVTFAVTFSAAILCFPKLFISIFNSSEQLLDVSIVPVRLAFSLAFVFGFQMISQHMFIAIGEAKRSFLFAIMRKLLLLMPIAIVLTHYFGVEAVFFAEPLATVITAIVTQIAFDRYCSRAAIAL